MPSTRTMEAAANVLRTIFPAVLLVCLAISGCGYGCYSGFWNGNTSGVAFSNTSCLLTKATGAVLVQMSTASAPSRASAAFPSPLASPLSSPGASPLALPVTASPDIALPNHVQHIFLTLRGIEAHPEVTADEDSSGWQELAPGLAAHAMQLDLLAPSALSAPFAPLNATGDSRFAGLAGNASVPTTVPADEYRQLRLRLLPQHPSPDDLLPENNACGNVGWNCVVFTDRSVRPLQFAPSELAPSGLAAAAEFRISPERGGNIVFRVLPGELIYLSIELDPASSVFFPSNAAVRLVPAFTVVSRPSSPVASWE